ncbi:putative mRNA cap guanine-N7 methyltransferase [Trypanosoma cruzi]|nr:putative mRNA cap guanine-N7 methyltransferase [Trypanosoma cruzi]
MLNINAKAFVPQSALEHLVNPGNAIYRYHLTLPIHSVCETSQGNSISNNIHTLLAQRCLCSSFQGGLGEEPLQLFLSSFFDAVENVPFLTKRINASSGIILSRTILSLTSAITSINAINEASGFLIHVDMPREYRAEVALRLRAAWDDFFEFVRGDLRITSFGYVGSSCGAESGIRYKGTFRHYFFLSFSPCNYFSEQLIMDYLRSFPFPFLRIVQLNAIVPFMCNSRIPMGLVISVGEIAKEKLLSDGKPDKTFSIFFSPYNVSETSKCLGEFEEMFVSFLKEYSFLLDRTYIVHIDIQIHGKDFQETRPIPVWDLVYFIGNLCEDTATSVLGVCFSDDTIEESIQLNSSNREGNVCYLNETLKKILEDGHSLDICKTYFGHIPAYIKRPMTCIQYESARKNFEKWLAIDYEPIPFTRMVFADAADSFAKTKYYVRNRIIGEKILLMTDNQGDIFAAEMKTGSIFALPHCFGGVSGPIKNTVFEAVLTSSFRGYLECIILVEDILSFEGKDVKEMNFTERWHHVEKLLLDDQDSQPHTNPDRVLIVRTSYAPFDQVEQVLQNPPLEQPTLGLVLVPQLSKIGNKRTFSYIWVPLESITARFFVGKVEDVPDTNFEIKRAWLNVRGKDNKIVPYNDEYADYSVVAHRFLESGSVIDCLLRRSDDGAHWWEIIRDYNENQGKRPHSYDFAENLVHVPGLTYEEMLWLLKAHSFKCGRCQTVSDVGKTNPRYQTYWCQKCWEETGHGECLYCGRPCSMGRIDSYSQRFYCDNCWDIFSSTNTNAEIGYIVPPPPNVSFQTQVLTRCVSILIDSINSKAPTNDVLELCCGGAVTRKWIKNKTNRYVGFDLKSSVVESTMEIISSFQDEISDLSSYDVICADAFSKELWTYHITKIHPRQFHTITVFAGFHHAFETEMKIRHLLYSIANTLVPRGVFLGCFFDIGIFYEKGEITNDLFTVEWDDDFLPRNGHFFFISMQNEPRKKMNVVAIDFLVAVAKEYGLSVIPEVCLTFLDMLENDPHFTMKFLKGEKEYLRAMRTFAFRKDGHPQPCALHKANISDGGGE